MCVSFFVLKAVGLVEQKKGVALFVVTTGGVYSYTITKDTISQVSCQTSFDNKQH
jgi:hypothetical protein